MATIDLGKISFTQKGTWTSGTSYTAKDVVQHTDNNETSSYVAIASSTGQAPSTNGTVNSSNWALFAKGVTVATNYQTVAWASGTTYTKGQIVQYTDSGVVSTYLCIANSSQGNAPSTSGTTHADWSYLAKGTAAAGISWQSVVTGATLTAVAGRAYPINTTSNACTVTLPAGSAGDRVVLSDYVGTWQTNNLTISANGTEKIKGVASQSFTCSQKNGSVELVYLDATQGWTPVATNNTTDIKQPTFEWLVVAGGGGASYDNGGGGGAGGMRYGEIPVPASATTYTVVIGGGGTAGNSGQSQTAGGDSTLNGTGVSVTSKGGGTSGSGGSAGSSGGSGGGTSQNGGAGGSAIAITQQSYETSTKQGNNGGAGSNGSGGGAGGGGAGGVGKSISVASGQASVGHGGEALALSITGQSVYYAGGGGGGANQSSESYFGLGGNTSTTSQKGGGANGAGGAGTGSNGTANTGGGGGGGGQAGDGGGGGSGVAIFKIKSTDYGSSTGSPTVDTSSVSGFTILTFNGGGTFTTA